MKSCDIIKYKKILIETLKAFNDFCEMHNLKYFACGGTAIGAVRHKGIIPWDDDIDVCMLRDDYNRFIELKDKCLGTDYRIIDLNDKGYYLPFAKFVNNNTTIWEYKEKPFIFGVFIDVFPLNTTNSSYEYNYIIYKKYNRLISLYNAAISEYQICDLIKKKELGRFKMYIKHLILKPLRTIIFKQVLKIEDKIKYNNNGDYLLNYYTPYKIEKELFPQDWFKSQITFPFENVTIKLPNGYHEYLTQLFGNYMTLPPIEKRIRPHSRYYYNLDKRLTIDEILSIKNDK